MFLLRGYQAIDSPGQLFDTARVAPHGELDVEPSTLVIELLDVLFERDDLAAVFVQLGLQASIKKGGECQYEAKQ